MVNEVYTFNNHVAFRPIFNCHQQMAIYAEEPLGGGKQTTPFESRDQCLIVAYQSE